MPRLRLLLCLAVLVPAALASSARASASLQFEGTGLEGGGFQNVVAVDPFDSGVVLSGGDVAGFQRSTDGGVTWRSANAGLSVRQQLAVASILFSTATPDKVYAAVGDAGNSGGLLLSTDAGRSWTLQSAAPKFAGGNAKAAGMPAEHPRSTGNLIAQDAAGRLYAATFKDGVMRSDDDGLTWTTLGLAGVHLRTLVLEPPGIGVLYAGSYGQGAFRIDDSPGGGVTIKPLGSSPRVVEELSAVGSSIFAAGGTSGLFRSDDGGGTWQHLGAGQLATGTNWTSLAARADCGTVTVVAGALGPGVDDVVRSTDGGSNWASLTADPAAVKTTVGGPSGHQWWLAPRSGYLLGGPMYTPAQIALVRPSACGPPGIFVAGRSGMWGSADDGASWYPMVGRMGVSIAQTLAVDPSNPQSVHVAATDWGYLGSFDRLDTVTAGVLAGAGPTAFDVAVESGAGARVYVTTGHRDSNTRGAVLSSATPSVNSSWVNEKLPVAGKRALAIAVGRQGANRILIAAVDAGGIWRKTGTTWKKMTTPAMATRNPAKPIQLLWPAGTGTVYLYDHKTGIWRSTDYGVKWTKIWAKPSAGDLKGYIATNATGTQLWVSTAGAVYRLDGANSGTVAAGVTPRLTLTWAGPVAFDQTTGTVYVAEQATPGHRPALWASTDGGASWQDVADDGYRAAALQVFDLTPDGTGGIWAALQGNGVIHGVSGP